MRFLAIENEVCPMMLGEKEVLLSEQSKALHEYYLQDYIRDIHQKSDSTETILIMECISKREAESLLKKLPLVRAGKVTFDVIPFGPYEGFKYL